VPTTVKKMDQLREGSFNLKLGMPVMVDQSASYIVSRWEESIPMARKNGL
jgi:hypothetical protein